MSSVDPDTSLMVRTPSMMMSGSFDRDRLFDPRMRMRDPPPVVPLVCVTTTFAAREDRRSFTPLTSVFGMESVLMVATLLPDSRRSSDSPVALTTTWSSRVAVALSAKSAVRVSLPLRVRVRVSAS
jgi:hypothetical protein